MKATYISIFFSVLTVIVFQNCAPSHTGNSDQAALFSIDSIYPYYAEKPNYFDSVQLTKVFQESGAWKYHFVAGVVFIDDPLKNINVEIKIFDHTGKLLCPRKTATVNATNNHIIIDNCSSGTKALGAKIEVYTKLASASGSLQLLSSYAFSMAD